ncbi:hypothetical protein FRC02_002217 [Tulasnella sp. 418]|nr:hypothetical protein FRC02_002217 [Tulasnella sp. 418]
MQFVTDNVESFAAVEGSSSQLMSAVDGYGYGIQHNQPRLQYRVQYALDEPSRLTRLKGDVHSYTSYQHWDTTQDPVSLQHRQLPPGSAQETKTPKNNTPGVRPPSVQTPKSTVELELYSVQPPAQSTSSGLGPFHSKPQRCSTPSSELAKGGIEAPPGSLLSNEPLTSSPAVSTPGEDSVRVQGCADGELPLGSHASSQSLLNSKETKAKANTPQAPNGVSSITHISNQINAGCGRIRKNGESTDVPITQYGRPPNRGDPRRPFPVEVVPGSKASKGNVKDESHHRKNRNTGKGSASGSGSGGDDNGGNNKRTPGDKDGNNRTPGDDKDGSNKRNARDNLETMREDIKKKRKKRRSKFPFSYITFRFLCG